MKDVIKLTVELVDHPYNCDPNNPATIRKIKASLLNEWVKVKSGDYENQLMGIIKRVRFS